MGESRAMTLLELLRLLKKRLKLVIVLPLVCALAVGGYSFVAAIRQAQGDWWPALGEG